MPVLASNAKTWRCGPLRYITPSTTRGELSNDVAALNIPVWNVQAALSCGTLRVVISVSDE